MYGHDHENTRANVEESLLSGANIATVREAWRIGGLEGVTGTPAVVEGIVYFGDWNGKLHAVLADSGETLWERQLPTPQINASPLVADGVVYVGDASGFLHAVNAVTGEVIFSVRLDSHLDARLYSSPVKVAGLIIVGVASVELVRIKTDYTFRGSVVALDALTGQERWRVYTTENDANQGAGAAVWSTAAVDEDLKLLFVGVGQHYEFPAGPYSDSLLAIRYETGQLAWAHQFTPGDVYNVYEVLNAHGPDADVGASPNLFTVDGRELVGVGDKAGVYWALDRRTGVEAWRTILTPGSRLGGVMVTAAFHDGVLYVNSNVGIGDHKTAGTTSVTFALDASDGAIVWEHLVNQPVYGAITWANGLVYFGTISGSLEVLDAASGEPRWRANAGGPMGGGVSVVNGTVFAGYGFWNFTRPVDLEGGLVAYRLR